MKDRVQEEHIPSATFAPIIHTLRVRVVIRLNNQLSFAAMSHQAIDRPVTGLWQLMRGKRELHHQGN